MGEKQMLAADFGGSGGRVIRGSFNGKRIKTEEVHRFANEPVTLWSSCGGMMYWDFLRLFHELKKGIAKAGKASTGIGIDTWGVDYGLLDKDGTLLANPVHYRDLRTQGMRQAVSECIAEKRMYQITGIQLMEINTVYQLMAERHKREALLNLADTLLFMSDLFGYFLSGEKNAEYSVSSTSQLLDAENRNWSQEILQSLGISESLFPPISMPGKRLGFLREALCQELSIDRLQIFTVAGHDTQSAMAAIPTEEEEFLFLSCGTWSLLGTERKHPLITDRGNSLGLSNEGGFKGKISFLKNIVGLWMIQESRRQWIRQGREYSFGELESMAREAPTFLAFLNPDAPEFFSEGDMPGRIQEFCRRNGQKIPQAPGEIVRCINESLAFSYRNAIEEIQSCTGMKYKVLYIVGGGVQSSLLCQMTANACGILVMAGPKEATVYGNLGVQLMAEGELASLKELRSVVRHSERVQQYEPQDSGRWEEAYQAWKNIKQQKG